MAGKAGASHLAGSGAGAGNVTEKRSQRIARRDVYQPWRYFDKGKTLLHDS